MHNPSDLSTKNTDLNTILSTKLYDLVKNIPKISIFKFKYFQISLFFLLKEIPHEHSLILNTLCNIIKIWSLYMKDLTSFW